MVKNSTAAAELAARLNSHGFRQFKVAGDRVIRRGPGEDVVLVAVSAGRGRPYEVAEALARAADLANSVIVGEEFTPGALDELTKSGANYMDRRLTHVWLSDPAFVVHWLEDEGAGPQEADAGELRLHGSSGGVVIALLEQPEARHKVTDLAERAGVSVATAQRVVFELEAEGFLIAEGAGPRKTRRIEDPAALLDRYAQDAARDRRRSVRCRVLGDSTQQIAVEVGGRLAKASIGSALTGVAAAMVEAPALTSVSVAEFWVARGTAVEYLRQAVGGISSEEGANVVLWRAGSGGPLVGAQLSPAIGVLVASRFRVYADLLVNPRRSREQAAAYRERVIGF